MNDKFNLGGETEFVKGDPADIVKKMLDVMIKEMTKDAKGVGAPMMMGSDFVPRIFGGLAFAMMRGTMASMADIIQDHKAVMLTGQQFAMDMNTAATGGIILGFENFAKEYKDK